MTSLEPTERDTLATGAVLVAQLELPVPVVTEAAAVARAAGSRVVLNAAPVTDLDAGLLALVDLLVVNEHEARALAAGAGDPWEAGRRLLGQVGSVVITLGAAGALLFDERGERPVPGVPATVVDTTGAGDTFTGVLAATLADGASADDAVSRAVVASALSVERAGAVPSIPTAAEVDARLAP